MKIGKVDNMPAVVLDTSVIIKWFFRDEEDYDKANEIFTYFGNELLEVLVPDLNKYEFGNVLLKKKVSDLRADIIISQLHSLDIKFVRQTKSLSQLSYKIAKVLNITYYDSSFLAIAKTKNIPLVTANPKHQRSIDGIKVLSLKDFSIANLKNIL
jgi:predicted nucleic acid-binding protein